jgi:hypothetical protein
MHYRYIWLFCFYTWVRSRVTHFAIMLVTDRLRQRQSIAAGSSLRHRTYPESVSLPAFTTKRSAQFVSPRSGWPVGRPIQSCANAPPQPGELYYQNFRNCFNLMIAYNSSYLRKTGGFFVECGAFDGEHGSNTLYMERHLQWKGILIEPDRKSFDKLLAKQRHSWALPVCLATEPHPTQVPWATLNCGNHYIEHHLSHFDVGIFIGFIWIELRGGKDFWARGWPTAGE